MMAIHSPLRSYQAMLFIPLPFVVALLLLVLFVTVLRRDEEAQPNRPFLALILLAVLQSVLSGLRWGYGVQAVGVIAPVTAAMVPPLAYAGVSRLVRTSRQPLAARIALHAVPAAVILLLMVLRRDVIDIALVLVFVGYALAILLLMRPGADALRLAPFEGAVPAYRAIIFAAVALCLSASVDIFVFLDFTWAHGEHALTLISVSNLAVLVILGIAAAAASRSRAPAETVEAVLKSETTEDKETIATVDALMEAKKLYRDANLNLDRLARKAGIPARQISTAINRAMDKNVSQYVNDYRIGEACRLLAATQKSVTEVMFEVGFQTKSNFNREFRRVTDMTPVAWRERKGGSGVSSASP
ncbi:helix-turn-helix domain-containing protein [Rhizobium leguminosarum]|uniref:helix-turn-helix domain-containing protein n=1 Tax=Rhizobium leguminosarum TaxID=384 RepID=UPI000369A03D|nr:AraC family transcriptional regulator [Rhizobium leguminosarum]MBY2926119.1 helix-turn-helix transcriptional regulator [Rhizobium leguminosarum]MBY2966583.1 helix-turn-helix transcriptional regulator [Rhizobium leguminosarum]MBY2983871.1 helix-turn-helix transcriptional regulator [Rhizobium leguminosarum]MBY3020788.1 helix-turn-helix transcriptional regulator [Rhizobium leguminosarum]MBY3033091.1 helix-turn-helix transcriptional regulator [Rhizobium leguminosarum]